MTLEELDTLARKAVDAGDYVTGGILMALAAAKAAGDENDLGQWVLIWVEAHRKRR